MDKSYKKNILPYSLSEIAIEAILYEVACFPSAGLVSPISSGAHKDMNYFTFLKSTAVLSKYMLWFSEEGYSKKEPKDIFKSIREIGMKAEVDMFKKTRGINTHKGMIFIMGICCAAVAKTLYDCGAFQDIRHNIRKMTEGIVKNELYFLDRNKQLTYGEKLFLKYGIEGIRGEAENGFPIIFDYSLDLYKQSEDLNENERLVHTLIGIMQYCQDTTILHRHTIDELLEVQKKAKRLMDLGGMRTEKGTKEIFKLDKEFTNRKISPGGSADILAATVYFDLVKKEYFKDKNYKQEKRDV